MLYLSPVHPSLCTPQEAPIRRGSTEEGNCHRSAQTDLARTRRHPEPLRLGASQRDVVKVASGGPAPLVRASSSLRTQPECATPSILGHLRQYASDFPCLRIGFPAMPVRPRSRPISNHRTGELAQAIKRDSLHLLSSHRMLRPHLHIRRHTRSTQMELSLHRCRPLRIARQPR